jgi:hypothetical protein
VGVEEGAENAEYRPKRLTRHLEGCVPAIGLRLEIGLVLAVFLVRLQVSAGIGGYPNPKV